MKERQAEVLLVVPGNMRQVYQTLSENAAIEPPVFAMLIASYLKNKGVSVAVLDAPAMGLTYNEAAKEVDNINPYLVVMVVYGYQPSASTQNMPAARETCKAIREIRPDFKIIITGTHPSALPERTLREEPIDFVCDGEGPITVHGLLEAIKANDTDFSKVRGLLFWKDGKIVRTLPAPIIENLDEEIPAMPWELLPMSRYRSHDWHANYGPLSSRMPYASIITTLGCPFHCEFCCIQAPFKSGEEAAGLNSAVNSYRFRSPNVIIKEIETLVNNYGVKNIKFHDELFVLNPNHVFGVTKLIKERFGDKLNIWAYTRVDTAQEEFLEDIRAAGIKWLAVGIESASEHVRDGAKKSFKDEDIANVCDRIHKADINIASNYIFGLPDDTYDTMKATFDLALRLNTLFANFYCAMAYPGSRLYKTAQEKKWPLPDDPGGPGWIGYSQHAYEALPLPTEKLTSAEVLAFRDKAWRDYNSRPEFLKLLGEKFGPDAVKTIQDLLALPPLRRKILEDKPR